MLLIAPFLLPNPFSFAQKVFLGSDLVSYILGVGLTEDRTEATIMGKHLASAGRLRHVHMDHHFRDARLFFRFCDNVTEAPALVATSVASESASLT